MPILNKIFHTKKDAYSATRNQYTIWKVVGLFIVGSLFAGSMLVFYFIYLYSYLTLSNSNTIITLNSNLAVDIVDTKTFKSAEEMIKLKKELPDVPEKIRNIFYYTETIVPAPTVTSDNTATGTTNTIKILFPTSTTRSKLIEAKTTDKNIKPITIKK